MISTQRRSIRRPSFATQPGWPALLRRSPPFGAPPLSLSNRRAWLSRSGTYLMAPSLLILVPPSWLRPPLIGSTWLLRAPPSPSALVWAFCRPSEALAGSDREGPGDQIADVGIAPGVGLPLLAQRVLPVIAYTAGLVEVPPQVLDLAGQGDGARVR